MLEIEVKEAVMCERCGEYPLGWLQSRAGKWYLAKADIEGGKVLADKMGYHRCKKLSKTDWWAAQQRINAYRADKARQKEKALAELRHESQKAADCSD